MDNKAVERNSKQEWLPPWTRLEHEARYDFAATFVREKRVVDCACGAGIGSIRFASNGASEVVAVDSSDEAVSEAQAATKLSNLTILKGSALKLDLPDDFADVYISLETIEHLEDDDVLVNEACRVLKPGGLFICSTPNRDMTNPGTSIEEKPWNEFHVREYNAAEFRNCLERKFSIERVYGQNPASRWRVSLGMRLAKVIGTGFVVKLNKLFKCRWFVFPSPKTHAVQLADPSKEYEFYVLIGRVPDPKP